MRAAAVASWIAGLVLLGCATGVGSPAPPFVIAVLPDTQNYVDYSHQRDEGFAIDASALFIEQMQYVADRAVSGGGDIAFVAAVGDIWQHQTLTMDAEHARRGFEALDNPYFHSLAPTPKTTQVEIPKAIEGFRLIAAAELPFGVAPGNHDYDAMWSDASFPPDLSRRQAGLEMIPEHVGMLHVGGLDGFRSAFGSQTDLFADKPWYVDSFRGGANSAQRFQAGGYTFLHVAIEMHADDAVLAWVRSVLAEHPGLPTILTTHDYLDARGQRRANPIVDLARLDPDFHNSAEQLWTELIHPNDQIFLVLCGHHHGQSLRIDENAAGRAVYQVMADYQDRGQAGVDQEQPVDTRLGTPVGIGDGWLRLMQFDLGADPPRLGVRTYSSHYDALSRDLSSYAAWYRDHEQPEMSDAEFHDSDDFELVLRDFRKRFGAPSR